MGSRLFVEYWMMPHDAISLCASAVDFARKMGADRPHLDVIPVFVEIKVSTVQQAGEPIALTLERAIRPERLCPLYTNVFTMLPPVDPSLLLHVRSLPRIRVERVEQGSALMDLCDICSRGPTVGDQISNLKCGHAFHSHCVVRWLVRSNLCPTCDAQEHNLRIPKVNAPAEESLASLSVS
ncbi:unnamed protein product [Cuscuta campestris]|uniref:RING-type domain-containing protein n=1 Tax=Cuscuta campestris TaxID=132261 RepID=A0A484MZK6_9ASTE|nr:unnamed protein product [Cuscuta campestris]